MDIEFLRSTNADVWVLDFDGTLYTTAKNFQAAGVKLIVDFIRREYALTEDAAVTLRTQLLQKHRTRTALVALQEEGVDVERYIRETYLALPLEQFGLARNHQLFEVITKAVGEKLVMTNSPSAFARSILSHLDCLDVFSNIYGIQEMNFVEKPNPAAFSVLTPHLGPGKRAVFIDDEPQNVETAQRLGYIGVHWEPS